MGKYDYEYERKRGTVERDSKEFLRFFFRRASSKSKVNLFGWYRLRSRGWGWVDRARGCWSRRGNTRRRRRPVNGLRPDQNGNDGSGDQPKGSMPHRSQDGRDRSRMTGQGQVRAAIVGEEIVEKAFEPCLLRRIRLALVGRPERIVFGESRLEHVAGVRAVDVGFAAATVACMNANAFAEKLGGNEENEST